MRWILVLSIFTLAVVAPRARAHDDATQLFADRIRPVLIDQCVKCHGGEKIKGGLDLTTREGLLHPGDEGPAIIPGKSSESRLMKLIRHAEEPYMPEKRDQLS